MIHVGPLICDSLLIGVLRYVNPYKKAKNSRQSTFLTSPKVQTWINCATNNTAQRVPCSVIEPIVELIKPFLSKKSCCPIVKISAKQRALLHVETKKRNRIQLQLHIKPFQLTYKLSVLNLCYSNTVCIKKQQVFT